MASHPKEQQLATVDLFSFFTEKCILGQAWHASGSWYDQYWRETGAGHRARFLYLKINKFKKAALHSVQNPPAHAASSLMLPSRVLILGRTEKCFTHQK